MTAKKKRIPQNLVKTDFKKQTTNQPLIKREMQRKVNTQTLAHLILTYQSDPVVIGLVEASPCGY